MPSLPLIPTPISASISIDTSFTPSPIAKVIHLPLCLKRVTISAFYFGDILQQIIDFDLIAEWKKSYDKYASLNIVVRLDPSTTIVF